MQTAYIKAVGNQNHALGNYLAGLNGANASMGGYIKSLVGAKAATIGLQVASVALNATITMGISLAISALVTQIQKWANAQEDARKKSVELTNSYKEQQSSLESQIEKYKELKDTLDDGNLSTDEARSIKEQLLEIQQSLIESYGDEASNIDLVNGKYREQLGLLGELSKEKATEYVTENRDVFADAKEALEKERTYNLGTVTSWNTYSPQTEDQKKLLDYIEAYSELLDLTYTGASGRGVTATSVSVSVKADVASADELMHQFATDLEKYGEENDIDVSGILEGISGQLKETWTDELTEYKTVYDEFMKAEIVRNDTLRPLYQESIQAVEDYNKALSTGEGIEEAKANLESVQQSVQSATGELEDSQSVFDGIYEGINKDAEAAYNLGKAFENDKTVQNYAEQLRGLTDVDLKAINFDNDNTEKGEEAFKGLMETLGLTEEQVQSLIDKLVELGYVQGKSSMSDISHEITVLSLSDYLNQDDDDIQKIKEELFELAKSGEITEDTFNSTKEYRDILSELGLTSKEAVQQLLMMNDLEFDLENWQTQVSNARSSISELKGFIDEINNEGISSSSVDKIVTDYPQLIKYLDDTPALISEINKLIEEQSEVAQDAGNMLIEYNRDAYVQIKNVAQDSLNDIQVMQDGQIGTLADMYKVDLNNYSSLAQAKKEIEFALLGDISEGWASLFGLQIDEMTGLATITQNMPEFYSNEEYQSKVAAYNEAITKLNKAKENFESGVNYGDFGTSSSSKSSKDSSKEFDWIEPLIDNIETKISRLDKVVDSSFSTFGAKNQALADQIHLVNEEIQLQQQAYEGYMAKANSIELSDHYKNLVHNGAINIEDITDEDLQNAISNYRTWYEKAQETQDKITDLYEQSNELHVSAFENGADELESLRDSQSISEREYLDRMTTLWEFYFENNVRLAEVAQEKRLELLEQEKDYLEGVANAAIDILGEQSDILKEKQEAEVEAIEAKKKPLEEQLELLEEAKDKEDRILALQKAQYELKRAQSQRDKLTYVDGQMVYRADDSAIRDAQSNLDDAEYDVVVGDIQDQIDAYDREIDKVNERYEAEIAQIEKVQNEWEKALALQERAVNSVNFESMFGEGSIAKLLAGDLAQVNEWKQTYLDTLSEIDITSNGQIGDITTKYAELAGLDLTNVTEQTKSVVSQFDVLNDAVNEVNSAIGSVSGEKSSNSKEQTTNTESGNKEENPNSLVGAIQTSYDVASEVMPSQVELMESYTASIQSAIDKVNELISSIERLNSMSISASGVSTPSHAEGTVGKAFANGTGNYKGLAHAEKNALRSEYGQPELTVYPDGTTELTTEPTMSDLPRNTVIFNEEQTKRIMNNEGTVIGNAYADGNAVLQKASTPSYLRPIQEGDKGYELIKAAQVYQDMLKSSVIPPINAIDKNVEMMTRNISNINTSNVNKPTLTINGGINVSCPGVNSQEIMNQVKTAMHREIGGIALEALQEASITR